MKVDVVGFGALNIDKLYQVNKIAKEEDEVYIKDLTQSCGGSAANTLIGLSRLGLNTGMIGKVAKDSEGNLLIKNLKSEGVNTERVIIADKGRSGTVLGFVDAKGQRALYVDPGVNDSLKPEEIKSDLFEEVKILHLTSFVGKSIKAQETLIQKLPSTIKISFDPGKIYAERGISYIRNILKRTNILLLNEGELKLLTHKKYKTIEDRVKSLQDYGIDTIVVKKGDKGSYAADNETSCSIKAFTVECKDTTGAGDAFNAGFIYGKLKGEDLYNSCLIGNLVAACCVEESGAIKGLPNSSRIKKKFVSIK